MQHLSRRACRRALFDAPDQRALDSRAVPPKVIGGYQILSTLGSGGIGTVYRALDGRSGEEVALKLLSTGPALDPNSARRMAREFEALYELAHPNVVRVLDVGVHRGYPFLAMELIEGLNLKDYLALQSEVEGVSPPKRMAPPRTFTLDGLRALGSEDEEASDGAEDSEDGSGEVFDVSRMLEEANSDPGLFSVEHASGNGPEALRRLADAVDEPRTGEFDDDSGSDLAVGPEGEASRPSAARSARNAVDLNRPERIGRLKDSLLQICEALAYVHAHGMVHRDLKPANIMVDEDRNVKLMDFGLAKFLAEDSVVTASGRIVGTYRYMAPEQLMGEPVDGRSDLYSVGVMLYEFLAGRPPFDARTPAEMWRMVLEHEPAPLRALNPHADPQLVRIASKLMRKEPTERYQIAEEICDELMEGD